MKPGLREDADVREERLAIDLKLSLRATAPWVTGPSLLLLHHGGRGFECEVDPTSLPQGLHYAEIRGYDANAEWRGPLFRVPITVVRPLLLAAQPGGLSLAGPVTHHIIGIPAAILCGVVCDLESTHLLLNIPGVLKGVRAAIT